LYYAHGVDGRHLFVNGSIGEPALLRITNVFSEEHILGTLEEAKAYVAAHGRRAVV